MSMLTTNAHWHSHSDTLKVKSLNNCNTSMKPNNEIPDRVDFQTQPQTLSFLWSYMAVTYTESQVSHYDRCKCSMF